MTSTELINNNEKERENGSVTLDFATRGIRSISPGNVHLNISETPLMLKYLSLFLLTSQNALLILIMRYVRTRGGDMFMATSAVIMAEILKFSVCLLIIFYQHHFSVHRWLNHLHENIILQPMDCLKVSVPSLIYTLQNNLLYLALSNLDAATFQPKDLNLHENIILQPMDCLKLSVPSLIYTLQNNFLYLALSNLDAATFQVTYQLKILTTAIFSVIMLRKTLTQRQWIALVILFVGISIVQLQPENSNKQSQDTTNKQRPLLGLIAVIVSCLMSGFAGVYFEKILKGTKQSIWLRNVQLGVLGTVIGFITMELKEGEKVRDMGFFFGYDWLVWVVICLQSLGGLLVAVVVKYADNILKGFATSAAIIVSCCASIVFFSFHLSLHFIIGAGLVMTSVYMYGKYSALPNLKPPPSVVTEKVRHI